MPGSISKAKKYDDAMEASSSITWQRTLGDTFLACKTAANARTKTVFGFDISSASLNAVRQGVDLPPDQLRMVVECTRKHSLVHLHLAFPRVLERGGFDVIGGKPSHFVNIIENRRDPHVANLVNFHWPSISGTSDLAYHFFALALDMLKPRGFAALLQPRQALNAPATLTWREGITPRQPRLLGIVQDHQIFAGASVHVSMIGLGPAGSCRLVDFRDGRITTEWQRDDVVGRANWWAPLSGAEDPVESLVSGSCRTVGDEFDVAASMTTGDAYAIREFPD
ncbi:MAG: hypothetical protein U0S12_02440 [Fimbriimonadales bacterium]